MHIHMVGQGVVTKAFRARALGRLQARGSVGYAERPLKFRLVGGVCTFSCDSFIQRASAGLSSSPSKWMPRCSQRAVSSSCGAVHSSCPVTRSRSAAAHSVYLSLVAWGARGDVAARAWASAERVWQRGRWSALGAARAWERARGNGCMAAYIPSPHCSASR